MLKSISKFFVRLAERWMPDPLVIAIALTIVCFAAAIAFTDFGVIETVDAWGVGYWSLLTFTCQILLILGRTSHPCNSFVPLDVKKSGY